MGTMRGIRECSTRWRQASGDGALLTFYVTQHIVQQVSRYGTQDGDGHGALAGLQKDAFRGRTEVATKGPWTVHSTFPSKGAGRYCSKQEEIEKLWRELFSDPSEWWDHREDNGNPRFPDFKHRKQAHKALWMDCQWIPPWVEQELAALPPGTIELSTFSCNQRLSRYTQAGQYEITMEFFEQMRRDGKIADRYTFFPVLKACSSLGLLEHGRRIHRMMQSNFETDLFIGNSLVDMYAKCGSIEEAERVFNKMPTRDVVGWTAMIVGSVKCGQGQKALELFEQMQLEEVDPNQVTFIGVLNACASLGATEKGRRAHDEMIRRGFESDVVVGNCLVDMYSKCGSIKEAARVFTQMPTRNVVGWNAMILGYVKCGLGQKALELFKRMQWQGVDADRVTFIEVLNACASIGALDEGRRTHEKIVQRGFESDVVVGNCLVDMYAKCASIEEAERVFNQMPKRNVVAWTAMIGGYVKCGLGQKALELFEQMQQQGVDPNDVTFIGVVKACASVAALEEGKLVHEEIIWRGYESDVTVGTCLVDMYAKCGSVEEAERVFNQMPTRNVVSWNTMILGYVKCGQGQKALELFEQMRCQGIVADRITFIEILNACASLRALDKGRHAHAVIIQRGFESDIIVGNCLVDMYAKCGSIEEAEGVFSRMPSRNVVAWTSMILGYGTCGKGEKALELFEEMQLQGFDPNHITFIGVLFACASILSIEGGRRVHREIIQRGYESNTILETCLVNMYAKCGSIEEAGRVFKEMPTRDVVAWNAMILGYVKCGEVGKALELFEEMQCREVEPDPITFVGVLNACASIAALEGGRRVHEEIIRRGFELNIVLGNCLVDMYVKCGSIEEAERVFYELPTRDAVAWTALILGYGSHGNARKAIATFQQMCKVLEVNGVTLVALLSACSHGGLVDEGLEYFKSMTVLYNIIPTVDHFACVVDLLGRGGRLNEAEDLIMSMPIDPDSAVWTSLLGACRAHMNVEVGEHCAKQVLELDPGNSSAYVVLADICVTAAGNLEIKKQFHQEGLEQELEETAMIQTNHVVSSRFPSCG